MKPLMPYESLHPQFDAESHARWQEFREREPYVEEPGLVFLRPKAESRTLSAARSGKLER